MLNDKQVKEMNRLFEEDLQDDRTEYLEEQKNRECRNKGIKEPFHQNLKQIAEMGLGMMSYAQNMHSNPYFYKYGWWVFSRFSTEEGRQFLSEKNMLCTHEAMSLIKELQELCEPFILYNKKFHRRGDKTPFDESRDFEWAVDYDDDPDPAWKGHK